MARHVQGPTRSVHQVGTYDDEEVAALKYNEAKRRRQADGHSRDQSCRRRPAAAQTSGASRARPARRIRSV